MKAKLKVTDTVSHCGAGVHEKILTSIVISEKVFLFF